ncbi:MAG: hypothetical protein Q9217_000640 [Psora testacea]
MKSLHLRKKREQDILAVEPEAAALPAPSVDTSPKHMDLLEAASQTGGDSLHIRQTPRMGNGTQMDSGTGQENIKSAEKKTQQRTSSFRADQSYRQIAYNQYLSQAFGLDTLGISKPQAASIERLKRPEMPFVRPDSDASAVTTDSMEVNFHLTAQDIPPGKDRRPKIQVQIPGKAPSVKRPTSTAHLATQINRQKNKERARQSYTQISPPSATGPQSGEAPARLSIVSPLSSVEMPKPRRPFSAFSLEEMTSDISADGPKSAPIMEKSSSSDSSEGTGDSDDRSSIYSRLSMSSLTSDTSIARPEDRRHSIAFSIVDPTAAGVFDAAPLVPRILNDLRTMKSTTSLAPNTNKPLPPEPIIEEVAPLRLPGQSYSCGSSIHPKRKAPTPLTISRASTVIGLASSGSSLRSKYTPADLDALDAAFMKSSPQVASFNSPKESSWEQAQNDLEVHLDTITEDNASSHLVPLVHDPLQISRGPNEMEPSRQAPPPPSSMGMKLSDGSASSRKRLQKRSSKHVVMQMKFYGNRSSNELRKRISAPVGGSLVKANLILGKSGSDEPSAPASASAIQMEREGSSESNWSSGESPETSYAGDSSSPNMSNREDSSTPETDVSSIPDHAFEEVRARLELLNPKNDSPSVFTTWGHAQPSPPVELPLQEQSDGNSRPTTSEPDSIAKDNRACAGPEIQIHLSPAKDDEEAQAEIAIELEAATDISQRRASGQESFRPRSLASIAMSEIPDMYADMPSSQEDLSAEEVERMISADAAEKVLLRILENLDNLQDLFATATVSRGFYRTFKRHELPLMKKALYGMSPAAWELREMSPPYRGLQAEGNALPRLDYTPSLYLQHYMHDMYTMIALKSIILIHCESFLRADTITALAGGETERASQIDDAFWRVWTFCQIFGCGSDREDDIVAQMDWLRGGPLAKQQKRTDSLDGQKDTAVYGPAVSFGYGNLGGLCAEDLYDMTEIWTCLGVLVRGFQGKRQEARDFGVFDSTANLTPGDVEAEDSTLEEWTHYLLTLAPPAVLDVTSPTTPTAATFAHARSRGYMNWTPRPVSRATFLKEAVSRVYQERIALVHPTSAPSSPHTATTGPASPVQSLQGSPNEVIAARWRCARHAAEIRAKRSEPGFKKLPPSEDRPMSNYPDVLEKLDKAAPGDAPPVPVLPASTPTAARHRPTASGCDTLKHMVSALVVPKGPQVRDPVDVAVERLVDMGFEPAKAKKALADTDTGNSVDFDGALELLVRERKRCWFPMAEGRYTSDDLFVDW